MKKIYVTIIFVLASAGVCKAQFFLGGELGIGGSSGKNKGTVAGVTTEIKAPSTFEFLIAPKLGYFINDKLSIGLSLSYGMEQTTTLVPTKETIANHAFGGSPYVRYAFASVGKFSFVAEGRIDVFGGMVKINPSAIDVKNSFFRAGISIVPVITYNLGEHFVFDARLNFLSLGYSHTRAKTSVTIGGVESPTIDSRNNFEFSVDSDNVLTTGFITIGAIYKF